MIRTLKFAQMQGGRRIIGSKGGGGGGHISWEQFINSYFTIFYGASKIVTGSAQASLLILRAPHPPKADLNYERRSSTWSSRRLTMGANGCHLMTHVRSYNGRVSNLVSNHPVGISLWDETGVPGDNPRTFGVALNDRFHRSVNGHVSWVPQQEQNSRSQRRKAVALTTVMDTEGAIYASTFRYQHRHSKHCLWRQRRKLPSFASKYEQCQLKTLPIYTWNFHICQKRLTTFNLVIQSRFNSEIKTLILRLLL